MANSSPYSANPTITEVDETSSAVDIAEAAAARAVAAAAALSGSLASIDTKVTTAANAAGSSAAQAATAASAAGLAQAAAVAAKASADLAATSIGAPGPAGPAGPATVVNGKSGGIITLDKSDISLGNVDNTSDATKASPGNPIGDALLKKANAADLGSAATLQTTQLSANNLWFNPDGHLGNGAEQILPNHALVVYGPDRWNFQQATLTPFQTISRVKMPEGDDAIYWLNGIKASGSNTFGVGTKTLTVAAGINFVDTFPLEMVRADDITKKMYGTVASYSGTTLVLNISSVAPGSTGTFSDWVVGRNGNTTTGPVVAVTNAPTPPGSDILYFADTSQILVGAPIEYVFDAQFNSLSGIQLGAYVVSKTPTSIRMSKPAVQPAGAPAGVAVVAPQTVRFYGDQGHFGYQDPVLEDVHSLRWGTSAARDTYYSFDVVSNLGGKRASIMMSGYKPAPPFIGRSFVQSFEMPTTRKRITIKIPGDTEGPDGSWTGFDNLYGALGFVWGSTGSVTSQNIPDGKWITSPPLYQGVGGSDQQTFQLGDVVGAWVKVTAVKWELDKPTAYEAPTTLPAQYPTPFVRLTDRKLPRAVWTNTGNALNRKKWQAYVLPNGTLGFGALYDAEDGETPTLYLNGDGSVSLPQYPDGDLAVNGSIIGSVPYAFTPYTPGVAMASGTGTFGPASGRYRKIGKTVFLQISIPVTNIGTGSNAIVVDLPIAPNGREWFLTGSDSSAGNGRIIFGRIPAGVGSVQIRAGDGSFPAVNGSTLNLSGFFEIP